MTAKNISGRKLILSDDSNNDIATDMVFNFSLKIAYDIILKSQESNILYPEIEIVLIIIYIVLIFSGVVSNFLVCFVVIRQCARKKMDLQKSRNLYIINLAVADLALCCICMPFTLIALIQRKWTFGSLLCKLVPLVQGANITVSAGTITAIAFDRYKTIVKSPSPNVFQSQKCSSVMLTIILIWILSFTVTSPLFFYTVVESVTFDNFFLYEKCIERWPSEVLHSAFTITIALVQFVIPVLALTVIHLKISSYLKFHIKPLKKTQPEIQIHSPIDPVIHETIGGTGNEDEYYENKSKEDALQKELLYIKRKESIGSENSQRSSESFQKLSESSRKNSESSRKNSDSSRNSYELSTGKKFDIFMSFREKSNFYGIAFFRISDKSKLKRNFKRKEIRRNRRTTFILSCIALVYATSWLPMTIFQIVSIIIPQKNQNPKIVYLIYAFCHILAMTSSITNPFLYGWLNTNFRKEFLNIFTCISNFYSKLLKSEFNSSQESGKLKKNSANNNTNKTEGKEIFAQITENNTTCIEQHSLEHKKSLNYKKKKLNTSIVMSPSFQNPCIKFV